jgi:hypothetical protein
MSSCPIYTLISAKGIPARCKQPVCKGPADAVTAFERYPCVSTILPEPVINASVLQSLTTTLLEQILIPFRKVK